MYPKDPHIPPGEEWYYELDGRSHGPISWSDLEELLSRSGDTAFEVRVRRGADGPWTQFRPASAKSAPAASKLSREGQPPRSETTSPRQPSAPMLRGVVVRLVQWDIIAVIGVWILLNVCFLSFWPQPHSSERRYLQTLREIESEVQGLRSQPTSDAAWHDLSERSRVLLSPMVSDLKKSASAAEPIRQQLLWSARDLVPKTIGPRSKERDEIDRRLKEYLDIAERELNQ